MIICDQEESYVYRLTDYLAMKKVLPFEIQGFTDVYQLQKYLETNTVQFALISEGCFFKEMQKWPIEHLVLLNESGYQEEELESIYKYQSADQIFREILNICLIDGPDERRISGKSKLKIIGIYTPIGRCLQTSFSFVLGQSLSKKNRVLYLNFENYSGLGSLLNREFKTDLSDLIYFFHNSREKFTYRMGSMVESVNGMDFIPPAFSYLDLMMITGNEWKDLFLEIEKSGEYEILILDLSDGIQNLFELLKLCEIVYTITRNDGFAMAKIDQYQQLLSYHNCEEVLMKTKKCDIPIFKHLPEGLEQLMYSELAEYVKGIITEDFYEQL